MPLNSLIAAAARLVGAGEARRLRIAVVAPNILAGDGTSNAARDTIRAVGVVAGWRIDVFARHCELPAITAHPVNDAEAVARHPRFAGADVIIYHFGFYDPLFEVTATGNGHARQIVFFHNITPVELLPAWLQADGVRSFEQLCHLAKADRLWPFTSTNAAVLVDAGMDRRRMSIVPPVFEWPPSGRLAGKPAGSVRLPFVGRMVQSKGVLDLLEAAASIRSRGAPPFRLTLVGAPVDAAYHAAVAEPPRSRPRSSCSGASMAAGWRIATARPTSWPSPPTVRGSAGRWPRGCGPAAFRSAMPATICRWSPMASGGW
jgi:glycosyltransferase involved in cell wall biosynthesis